MFYISYRIKVQNLNIKMTIVQYFYFFFPVSGWQATVATVKPLGVQVIDAEKEEL